VKRMARAPWEDDVRLGRTWRERIKYAIGVVIAAVWAWVVLVAIFIAGASPAAP
jgi:hypothetical protein